MTKTRSFLSCFQLDPWWNVSEFARDVKAFSPKQNDIRFDDKIVGILLDEPSTRTRFSVESAAYRLGANCIVSLSMSQTSVAKGESFMDSAKIWGINCDILCVRHRRAGFARLLSQYTTKPVINLGDGFLEHPTQGLATVVHASLLFGEVRGLNICIWGDIAYSRCAHSVMIAFALLGASVWLCPRPPSDAPVDLMALVKEIRPDADIRLIDDMSKVQNTFEVLYVNRLQSERREGSMVQCYGSIGSAEMRSLSPEGILLHPLPRGEELPNSLLGDPRVRIWQHVDITYRTRQWLMHEYLAHPDSGSDFGLLEFPFTPTGSCLREDCASQIFPGPRNLQESHGETSSRVCHACLRTIDRERNGHASIDR